MDSEVPTPYLLPKCLWTLPNNLPFYSHVVVLEKNHIELGLPALGGELFRRAWSLTSQWTHLI